MSGKRKLVTTLQNILNHDPCSDGLKRLVAGLEVGWRREAEAAGKEFKLDLTLPEYANTPVGVFDVVEHVDVAAGFWCLGVFGPEHYDRIGQFFAVLGQYAFNQKFHQKSEHECRWVYAGLELLAYPHRRFMATIKPILDEVAKDFPYCVYRMLECLNNCECPGIRPNLTHRAYECILQLIVAAELNIDADYDDEEPNKDVELKEYEVNQRLRKALLEEFALERPKPC